MDIMVCPLNNLNIDTNQYFKQHFFPHHKGIQKLSQVLNSLYNHEFYVLQNIAMCGFFFLFFFQFTKSCTLRGCIKTEQYPDLQTKVVRRSHIWQMKRVPMPLLPSVKSLYSIPWLASVTHFNLTGTERENLEVWLYYAIQFYWVWCIFVLLVLLLFFC